MKKKKSEMIILYFMAQLKKKGISDTSCTASAFEKLIMNEYPLDATSKGRFSLNNSCIQTCIRDAVQIYYFSKK